MAQGLDRRLTLHVEAEGHREQGVSIPGPTTSHAIWATLDTAANQIQVVGGAFRLGNERVYVVRWRQDLATTPTTRLQFTSETGALYTITRVEPVSTARRRFLQIFGEIVT